MSDGSLHRALEAAAIPSADARREQTIQMLAPARRRRRPTIWFGACVAAIALALSPVGPATADFVRNTIGSGSEVVCPAAQRAYADAGIQVDTFSPDCPSASEVRATVAAGEQLEERTNAVRAAAEAPLIDLRERIAHGEELHADVDPALVLAVIDAVVGPDWDHSQGIDEDEATAVFHQLRQAGDLPPPGSTPLKRGGDG